MTDAEIVEQAIRRVAATVDNQVKYYLIRVADEIYALQRKNPPSEITGQRAGMEMLEMRFIVEPGLTHFDVAARGSNDMAHIGFERDAGGRLFVIVTIVENCFLANVNYPAE